MNMRWAAKEQNIPNLCMKSDDKFPTASRFKQLLLNSKNKVKIQNLIENKLQEYAANMRLDTALE